MHRLHDGDRRTQQQRRAVRAPGQTSRMCSTCGGAMLMPRTGRMMRPYVRICSTRPLQGEQFSRSCTTVFHQVLGASHIMKVSVPQATDLSTDHIIHLDLVDGDGEADAAVGAAARWVGDRSVDADQAPFTVLYAVIKVGKGIQLLYSIVDHRCPTHAHST